MLPAARYIHLPVPKPSQGQKVQESHRHMPIVHSPADSTALSSSTSGFHSTPHPRSYVSHRPDNTALPDSTFEEIPISSRPSASFLPELTPTEREFFELIYSGDAKAVSDFLDTCGSFNINCQNFQGYTGLVLAVKSEDVDIVKLLLLRFENIVLGDSMLHAAKSGNCSILELLLSVSQGRGLAEDEQKGVCDSADFSSILTPLMVAAHNERYEAIRLLRSRGHLVQRPHPPGCLCPERCKQRRPGQSLDKSRERYNAYRALASPSYIAHFSPDPILTAFGLSHELRLAAEAEPEFNLEYFSLAEQCNSFAVSLLDHCRTAEEVEMLLHKAVDDQPGRSGKPLRYARVQMALDLDQKSFIAHANCQEVLRGVWLEDWQDWVRLTFLAKCSSLLPRVLLLPFMALTYLVAPNSKFVRSWRTPLNKFLSFAASYATFLEVFLIQNILDNQRSSNESAKTGLELFIVLYITGFTWRCFKQMWKVGLVQYARYKWNLYDLSMIIILLFALLTWTWSALEGSTKSSSIPRMYWRQYDPTLISEASYSVALILAFGKVMYFLQIGSSLGPLQLSLSRMLKDIFTFLLLFLVVITSFAVGMQKLYYHYRGQVRRVGGVEVRQSDAFSTISKSLETLYWGIYGYSPPDFADVIISEHIEHGPDGTRLTVNQHNFTETVGHLMLACYYITGVIVLINMLIAMMSNSFTKVQGNEDTEWKFARTKVWMSFFDDSAGTLPPPFNLIPSPKTIVGIFRWIASALCRKKKHRAKCSLNRCCYLDDDTKPQVDPKKYALLVSRLLQRYLTTRDTTELGQPAAVGDLEMVKSQMKDVKQQTNKLLERNCQIHISDMSDTGEASA